MFLERLMRCARVWATDSALARWQAVRRACIEAGLGELNASRIGAIATDGVVSHGDVDWEFTPLRPPGIPQDEVTWPRDNWRTAFIK